MLQAGETRVKAGGDWTFFATGPGFCKVHRDRALVLVDDAVRDVDIDVEEAQREVEQARAALERADADEDVDRWQLEQRLRHAENKIAVAGR
jgi:F0F1-type ATP synthase epsilon subunit